MPLSWPLKDWVSGQGRGLARLCSGQQAGPRASRTTALVRDSPCATSAFGGGLSESIRVIRREQTERGGCTGRKVPVRGGGSPACPRPQPARVPPCPFREAPCPSHTWQAKAGSPAGRGLHSRGRRLSSPPHGGCRVEGGAEAGARAGVRGPSQASLSNVKAIKATSSVRSGRASGSGAAARTHLTGALLRRGCAGHTGPCPVGRGPGRVHLELAQSWPWHPWGSRDSRPSQGRLRKQDAGTAGSRGPCGVRPGRSLHWGQGAVCPPPPLEPRVQGRRL